MTEGSQLACLHLLISGRVQGVGFRFGAAKVARDLGLRGWVRNLPDGRVEIMAEGERAKLQALRDWTAQGPPLAKVTEVREEWLEFKGKFSRFEVR